MTDRQGRIWIEAYGVSTTPYVDRPVSASQRSRVGTKISKPSPVAVENGSTSERPTLNVMLLTV